MNLDYLQGMYQLKATEIQILTYLDQKVQEADEVSIRQAARECFTSPASIVRLAQKLNLSGYRELLYKLKESHLSPQTSAEVALTEAEINTFCQLLAQHQGQLIFVLGSGFSAHLSGFFSEVLNFHCIPSVTTAHTQFINSRNSQNFLLLVISHSGEESQLKETVQLVKQKAGSVIAFLGTRQSRIAEQADLVFSTESYSPFSTSVARPQLFFGKTLVTFESLICEYINTCKN